MVALAKWSAVCRIFKRFFKKQKSEPIGSLCFLPTTATRTATSAHTTHAATHAAALRRRVDDRVVFGLTQMLRLIRTCTGLSFESHIKRAQMIARATVEIGIDPFNVRTLCLPCQLIQIGDIQFFDQSTHFGSPVVGTTA